VTGFNEEACREHIRSRLSVTHARLSIQNVKDSSKLFKNKKLLKDRALI